ncbi:hypothetical protein C0580_01045 [Candidatus Parcubacteria bacterium]|nr:MAG: hypothetical protein C0580_01045 [Candidatus Parcubacteria bacterium]
MPKKFEIYSKKILLSTGEFTTEVAIKTKDSVFYGSAPLGLTVGLKEEECSSTNSKSIKKINAIKNILELNQSKFDELVGEICDSQTSTALSLAFMKYQAAIKKIDEKNIFKFIAKQSKIQASSPKIITNLLNGGKHSENRLAFCEFMIIPQGKNTQQNIKIASEIYLDLKNIIKDNLGDDQLYIGREGGFAPLISNVEKAIGLLNKAINKRNKNKCHIAIDVAGNNFAQKKQNEYIYTVNKNKYNSEQLIKYYDYLTKKFPLIKYLEDPLHENDIESWKKMNKLLGKKILIVADDLTNSTLNYIDKYKDCFNACILKVNQATSISKLMESYKFCVKNKIKTIISHRSGEVDSNIISHLASGLASDYIKAGAPARERIVKYNELIRISDQIKK